MKKMAELIVAVAPLERPSINGKMKKTIFHPIIMPTI